MSVLDSFIASKKLGNCMKYKGLRKYFSRLIQFYISFDILKKIDYKPFISISNLHPIEFNLIDTRNLFLILLDYDLEILLPSILERILIFLDFLTLFPK